MNYYECIFNYNYTSPLEAEIINDVLAAELGEIGFESFGESAEGLQGYIPEKLYDAEALKEKLENFPLEGVSICFTASFIKDKDWNEEWEKNYFKPTTLGNDCIIHASFHTVEPGYTYDIVIDPKMAFGTGNHETTRLMLGEILRLDLEDKEVLDMGSGTAVLSILSAMKGAARVVAVDIDEWAYRNALENIRLNHTEDINVVLGGAEQIPALGQFDIVLANINRNILLRDIKHYAQCMKHEALLIMSGFYIEDLPAITGECIKNGIALLSANSENKWAALIMKQDNIL
ncbi:ribosomal protein L11 methyltransferase [Bacteroidia bacterium]|nr:ribosomal protein L11 methyltransferase [Bacteroidia bacterium]